ncbi:hypothetical protein BDV12DRAFT_181204 [Aspergillus spectabilis]
MNNLLALVENIDDVCTTRHAAIHHGIQKERRDRPIDLSGPLFRAVIGKISTYALRIVLARHNTYLPPGDGKKDIIPCTGIALQTAGLPCIHTIMSCLESSLQVAHFHRQWWLSQSIEPLHIDTRLLIRDPIYIPRRKRKNDPYDHTRESTHPERVEAYIQQVSQHERRQERKETNLTSAVSDILSRAPSPRCLVITQPPSLLPA